jgi:hypothetical protein
MREKKVGGEVKLRMCASSSLGSDRRGKRKERLEGGRG